jgi:hypothetical protein
MNEETAKKIILRVIGQAKEEYPECFSEKFDEKCIETDFKMEDFIAKALGYENTWWYAAEPNCCFVVRIGSFHFDVDPKTQDVWRISEREFLDIYES